ncbi:hypothetical protein BY996DRAFT_1078092 [Phakopsora pachyrhizi]|nr:hypothetical protein BY996DRAFT_1078092 [Phakopsora pachyrhizi]
MSRFYGAEILSTPSTEISQMNSSTQSLEEKLRHSSQSTSTKTSSLDSSSDPDKDLINQEWLENLNQLTILIDLILLPFFGKWLGRRTAHWIYSRTL